MRYPDQTIRDRVYIFVHTYIRTHGYAPTQHEIAAGAQVSRTRVTRYLRDLEAQGRIVLTEKFMRNIQLAA